MERESDLTMGDFWGIDKVRPEWDDGMGTSLVIVHSKKGMALWESVAIVCPLSFSRLSRKEMLSNVQAKSDNDRIESSSGGVFPVLD